MANLSSKTGTTPVNTRIGLANNQASTVQNFNGYDSQELTGHVFIDGTTAYRAAVKVTVVKNGSGIYEVAATDVAGDDIGGSPIVTFSMSGSILQATLPDITGFSSAYIDYHLVSPILNATYPLSVDVTSVQNIVGTVSESSGIPTGSIIESGSNANGNYIKYADGTMICTVDTGNISITNSVSSIYSGTWPVAFAARPIANITQAVGHGDINYGAAVGFCNWNGALSSTGYAVRFKAWATASTSVSGHIIAIGRWY